MLDLHVHSTASDGKKSPKELVEIAAKKKLNIFAITDHDTVAGVDEALEAGKQLGVRVVAGVEMSVSLQRGIKNKALHLLGYGIDTTNQDLLKALEEIRLYRKWRIEEMLKNLNIELEKDGLQPISRDKILANISPDTPVGRPILAQYLLDNGYVQKWEEAFDKWLTHLNIPNKTLTIEEGITLIRRAGGVSVLAHPGLPGVSLYEFSPNISDHREIICYLRECGLDGLEVCSSKQSKEDEKVYIEIAKELNMLTTAGSDFHGGGVANIWDMGVEETEEEMGNKLIEEINKRKSV